MASSGYNENNSIISSCNDKSISRSHLNEHEETMKSEQMASSKKLSDSNDEEIANLNDNDLKNLLDEAMNYKNPHDIANKSETFKRLLQNVTEEDERKRKFESDSLRWKAQSNSLQNLLDDSHYHLQSNQSQNSSKKHQQRRKNSTSVSARRLEGGSLPIDMHHSSVVQSPPDQPFLYELKNSKKRKEKQQQQAKDTVIDMADIETDDNRSKSFLKCLDSSKDTSCSLYDTTMIEMKSFTNRSAINDIEVLEQSPSSKFTIANNTPNTITSMASTGNPIPCIVPSKVSSNAITNSVESTIHFPSIEKSKSYSQAQYATTTYAPSSTINHSNHIVLTPGDSSFGASSSSSGIHKLVNEQPIQLPSGPGINSVMDARFATFNSKIKTGGVGVVGGQGQIRDDVNPMIQTSSSSSILPASHTSNNTSSKDSKNSKKRAAKSERNVKNVEIELIDGYRGMDDVEKLLDYIEGQNPENKNQKNHPKNGIVSSTGEHKLLSAEEKKKKLLAKNKEKMNKLKKSNSMDELCSTNRQKETQAAEAAESVATANKIVYDVTLRSKSSNMTSGAKKSENKSSSDKIQSKRNERRSWGTEGLWPDSLSSTASCLQTAKDNHQDEHQQPQQQQEVNETSSSSSSSGVQLDFADTVNLTNIETISASSEADKFQVVSKKRKVKRKSNEAPEVTSKHHNLHMPALRRDGNNLRSGTKYTSNENSRNDSNIKSNNNKNPKPKPMSQDAKQITANKSRRKSTSSMPPSEEGDDGHYSDGGDSVQSLPIENTKSLLSATATASAPHTSAENSGKSKKFASSNPTQISPSSLPPPPPPSTQQQQQKPTTFSYADIAKTNTNRTNNNVIAASTEKWPSISSSSSSHQNNNNSNAIDPFAISNFDAINNNNINNNSSSLNVNNVSNVATVVSINASQKQQQSHHKSTPTIISASSMSFPDLVENNNNRNKQLSNTPLEIQQTTTTTTSNGDATQTEKTILNNGLERGTVAGAGGGVGAFDNNNNNSSSTTSTSSNTDDRINNNSQKISYSQSLLEKYSEIDSNGNNAKLEANSPIAVVSTITQTSKNVLTKSKSVDHNNLSSIEHYPALEKTKQTLSDVLSKPIESLSTKTKTKQQSPPIANMVKEDNTNNNNINQSMSIGNVNINSINPTSAVIMMPSGVASANGKRAKKDKLALKKSTSTVSTSTTIMDIPQHHQQQFSTQNVVNHHHHHQQQQRPAVIILDDDCEKSNDFEFGITFGFDINEHLLFGHQNGDDTATAAVDLDHPSVEMNINNNSNCDIMNTNLSSNNININNLTNQSCGFEMYENFIASPQSGVVIIDHSQQLIHQPAIIQSSSPKINTSVTASPSIIANQDNITSNNPAANTNLDSSNDLGYLSSSMLTNSTTSPANQKNVNESDNIQVDQQHQQNAAPMDIKQHMKYEELKMLALPRFISPEPPAKNFNYEELVSFVSEEWTKVMNNGVIFNGLQMI